jgi:hypothetical protein
MLECNEVYRSSNVEESCTFQKIYGLGKIKLKMKWPGGLEKAQI